MTLLLARALLLSSILVCTNHSWCRDSIYRRMEFNAPQFSVCANLDIANHISNQWLRSMGGCDLNRDSIVNFVDYAIMIRDWKADRRSCP